MTYVNNALESHVSTVGRCCQQLGHTISNIILYIYKTMRNIFFYLQHRFWMWQLFTLVDFDVGLKE